MGAPEEHPRVGALPEPGSVLLRSRSQGRLLSGAAISHHPQNMRRRSQHIRLCLSLEWRGQSYLLNIRTVHAKRPFLPSKP